MKKVFFIYNPMAGQIQIKSQLWDILNTFARADYDVTVRPTTRSLEARDMVAARGREFDLIICSGGDGTLNEVVNGLLEIEADKRPLLGYIPAGSTNDYAYSLKLPKNMKQAAQRTVKEKETAVDIGDFNGRKFVYVAAFGLFSEVSYETNQDMKNALGHFAYLIEGVKSLTSVNTYHLKVTTEDGVHEGDYLYGMVTNSLSVGGIYRMREDDVSFSDGEFEVMLVKQPKTLEDFSAITDFFTDIGGLVPTEMVESFKCSHLSIESAQPIKWALDGEEGGSADKVEITVLPKAVRILT